MPLDRGVIIDSAAGAVAMFLDELHLCGRCVAEGWLLLDPHSARTARQQKAQQQEQLAAELAELTKIASKARGEISGYERQLEKLRTAQAGLDALRVGTAQWVASHDALIGPFERTRLQYWALQLTTAGGRAGFHADDSAEAEAEIKEARQQFEQARGLLRKSVRVGERLRKQCENNALNTEFALLDNRLRALGDLDDDEPGG